MNPLNKCFDNANNENDCFEIIHSNRINHETFMSINQNFKVIERVHSHSNSFLLQLFSFSFIHSKSSLNAKQYYYTYNYYNCNWSLLTHSNSSQ